MNKLIKNVIDKTGKAITKVKDAKNTPKVMMVTGIVTIVGAGVYACVQTLKLEDKVDEAKESIDHIKDLKEDGEYVVDSETGETAEYGIKEYRKDMAYVYGRTAWEVTKLYLPSLVATGVGVALIGGSNKIMDDRVTQATLAFTALSESFGKYRQNVINDQGEDADRRYLYGIETKKNLEMNVVDPETGEVVTKKEKKIDVVYDLRNIASPYSFIFNDCNACTGDFTYDTAYINSSLNILQAQFDKDNFIYFYDILKQFGAVDRVDAKTLAMSHQVGLIKGFGDSDIRCNPVVPDASEYMSIPVRMGSEDIYRDLLILDFNCIGGEYVGDEYKSFNELVAERFWLKKGF